MMTSACLTAWSRCVSASLSFVSAQKQSLPQSWQQWKSIRQVTFGGALKGIFLCSPGWAKILDLKEWLTELQKTFVESQYF